MRHGAVVSRNSLLFVDTVCLVYMLCIKYFCNLINTSKSVIYNEKLFFEVLSFKESFGMEK